MPCTTLYSCSSSSSSPTFLSSMNVLVSVTQSPTCLRWRNMLHSGSRSVLVLRTQLYSAAWYAGMGTLTTTATFGGSLPSTSCTCVPARRGWGWGGAQTQPCCEQGRRYQPRTCTGATQAKETTGAASPFSCWSL